MAEVLEQLQLSIGTLGKNRSAEGLHDLLDRNGLSGQLIARRAIGERFRSAFTNFRIIRCSFITYQTRPKAPMPTGCRSEYLESNFQQRAQARGNGGQSEPACDLEGGTEDLGPHEFRHIGRTRSDARAATSRVNTFCGRLTKRPREGTEASKVSAEGKGQGNQGYQDVGKGPIR